MNTKQQVALLLEQAGDGYVSGSAIAERLGLTRAAVWKCIRQLEADGYGIESAKRGYRLSPENDAVSENSVRGFLGDLSGIFDLEVLPEVDSTNTYLKSAAARAQHSGGQETLRDWHTVIAASQSGGRGRMGRSFLSPPGTGLYLSVLLRPRIPAEKAVRITTAAAVAACLAIEACTDERAEIKWVNDVFVRGRKTCGILTEASVNLESGGLDWAVMGIGFNVYEPEGGFPEELKQIAGAVSQTRQRNLRSRIAAEFLREFYRVCSTPELTGYADEYRQRSFLIGKKITVISGNTQKPARAVDVDGECRLVVEYEDGTAEALSSGEVSVRTAE